METKITYSTIREREMHASTAMHKASIELNSVNRMNWVQFIISMDESTHPSISDFGCCALLVRYDQYNHN